MFKKIFTGILTIIGILIGAFVGNLIANTQYVQSIQNSYKNILIYSLSIVLLGIIFYFLSSVFYNGIESLIDLIEKSIQNITITDMTCSILGMFLSLILTTIILSPITRVLGEIGQIWKVISGVVFVLINFIAVIVGATLSSKKREEIIQLFHMIKRDNTKDKKVKVPGAYPKVLDTSVIIDGRIFDLCQTGFIEGPLVIPNFVLDELRHISDSADSIKRTRGRRGLDIINKIQKELNIEVQNYEGDFPEIQEVDIKLLKLAQKLNGKVVTNDFNLNKVAEFRGVPVLNINELANAIKPVVLPGEELKLAVVKDGKESGQGIGYLDDGTMIVVEGGRKYVGQQITTIVTSVLQTSAGRMIFAKKDNEV